MRGFYTSGSPLMRRLWLVIAGTVFLLASAFLVGLLSTRSGDTSLKDVAGTAAPSADRARVAEEVRYELETSYYRLVDDDVLARRTVDAILKGLDDPYTEYLSPTEYGLLESSASGRYSGVGLHVNPSRDGLLVTSALEGPAREAGIRRGDVIVSIDGHSAARMQFERSLILIQGEEGTTVRLTVRRPRIGKLRFTLVRQELPAPTSLVRMHHVSRAKVGYVRLYSFSERTSGDLRVATRRLVSAGARGLVLDLRDNPGGLLLEAVRSVSLFLKSGVVCTTEGAHQARRVFEVTGPTPFPRLPVAVLVNRGSASASEIVAAGLVENGRAVVVGQRTYGKAAVQSLHELSNGAALKLTTAIYRTPRGRDLLGSGVRPAVKALDDPATVRDEALRAANRSILKVL
jgi:carboxyl-terminal processing protease